jgi:hypothetical protein
MPARQVLHKHLAREGLVKKRRRSRRQPHPGRPTAPFDAPNSIWSADFKGQFKTLDGIYCYPLTVQDGHSRFLLGCQGLGGTTYVATALPMADPPGRCELPRGAREAVDVPGGRGFRLPGRQGSPRCASGSLATLERPLGRSVRTLGVPLRVAAVLPHVPKQAKTGAEPELVL